MIRRFIPSLRGISLIETLVGLAVFMIIAVSVYQAYTGLLKIFSVARVKIIAGYIGNEQMEVIRNLSYASVGTVGGVPAGILPPTQNITRDTLIFTVTTVVRNIDDPFDGTTKTIPRDLSPADYKLVQLDISCSNCASQETFRVSARVSPAGLETASSNGSLFFPAIDESGEPVSGATGQGINTTLTPQINITDTTDMNGVLQIIDAPPANQSYQITVSKTDYSTERTYPIQSPTVNPVNPHATVALQEVTQATFAIDRVGQINVYGVDESCVPVSNFSFTLDGSKLINTDPVIRKYSVTTLLGPGESATVLNNMEWDSYSVLFDPIENPNDLIGLIPPSSFNVTPGTNMNLKLVLKPEAPNALVVTVKDIVTRLPLSGALVSIFSGVYPFDGTTGIGSVAITNWYQAPFCQGNFCVDPILNGENVVVNNPIGEIRLATTTPNNYYPSGWLIGKVDVGSPANFYYLYWQPANQPPDTGPDSVKMQVFATTSPSLPPDAVFTGPDGTPSSYYTLQNNDINPINDGFRYLYYKIYLTTATTTFSPTV